MPLAPVDSATAAQAIVEEYIRRPIAFVAGDTSLLFTGEDGVITLPRRPVVALGQVQYMSDLILAVLPVLMGDQVGALQPYAWVTVTYDHGWHTADVPPIILAIAGRVAARLGASTEGLKSERIGAYSVDYGEAGSAWLTDDEQRALHRFRLRTTTLLMSTPTGGLQ